MRKRLFICLPLCLLSATSFAVDFNRDIRPILSDKCFACHGFDEHDRKADLRLDTAEGAFADLGGYAALVPGNAEKSEAWLRIASDDPDEMMPPPKFHKPLLQKEKELIRQWIAEGAVYKTHWSFAPLTPIPGAEGSFNIDSFIDRELATRQIPSAPRADKTTLARRLHFDLLGLPPTAESVDEFVRDDSTGAYEKRVDSLLAHPAFGERLAVYWLDLVRYADTIGYHSDNFMEVSAYRDYVISAFNRNLPFDQFTIEQLAGDLLPDGTLEQKIASGYNRLLQTTEEGGAQAEEYMVIYSADRVRNVSSVWLGSTIGCAQCHDHKYDPFSMRDFYTLAAFFADIKENAVGRRSPNLTLPTEEEKQRLAVLEKELAEANPDAVLNRDSALMEKITAARETWEKATLERLAGEEKSQWKVLNPAEMKTSGGQTLALQKDGSILTSGTNPAKDDYSFVLDSSGKITAIRLEALTDNSLVRKSLSRSNGNFVLTSFRIQQGGKDLKIARAVASFEQEGHPVNNAIDDSRESGWAVDGHNKAADHEAMFILEEPVDLGEKGSLTVVLEHQSPYAGHNIGKLRLAVTQSEAPGIAGKKDLPKEVITALKKSRDDRNNAEKKQIDDHFRSQTPLLAEIRDTHAKIKADLDKLNQGIQTMLVSEALAEPRVTRLLHRGDWLDKNGEIVQPALPTFLPKDQELPQDRRGNRLDLAQWVVADSNPLTSRAFVNRVWMLFFGHGISRNVDDLGGQGDPPSHPELLDQLAVDFKTHGWDIKRLIRQIVLSDAYQRSSVATPDQVSKDPLNLYLSRQGRWRIEAEFVRDGALQLSGLLVDKQDGKSVKPYQPAGYWQHLNFPQRTWDNGKNDDLYRRSLYTFRCRTFPHPAMVAFDAPSREECTSQRSRSNIPQQALVLLNDPSFVEAARKFAERVMLSPGNETPEAKIRWAMKQALSREVTAEEMEILQKLYQAQAERYRTDETAARNYLSIGDAPRSESLPPAELAAWTQVIRAVLNAYETAARN